MTMNMKMCVLWDVAPCNLLGLTIMKLVTYHPDDGGNSLL